MHSRARGSDRKHDPVLTPAIPLSQSGPRRRPPNIHHCRVLEPPSSTQVWRLGAIHAMPTGPRRALGAADQVVTVFSDGLDPRLRLKPDHNGMKPIQRRHITGEAYRTFDDLSPFRWWTPQEPLIHSLNDSARGKTRIIPDQSARWPARLTGISGRAREGAMHTNVRRPEPYAKSRGHPRGPGMPPQTDPARPA